MKLRLDHALTARQLTPSRSQAESWIRMGKVTVDGKVITKPGFFVSPTSELKLVATERYVSRAGLKLASVADKFGLDFVGKVVLDVGSSTGGFTDYALQHGARKVIAVDVGTDQMHPSLRINQKVELHEKTDIRGFKPSIIPDVIVIDVSFVSLRQILPDIVRMAMPRSQIVAMVKPQFEAAKNQIGMSGIIRNDTVRREILKDFETWSKQYFVVVDKADSEVKGAHGNQERFYLLSKLAG